TDHGQAEQDRVHKGRFVRFGVRHDGAWTLEARLTKVAGAKVQEALEHYAKIEFETARSTGVWAHRTTYLADGLVAMCEDARHGGARRARGTGTSTRAGAGQCRGATFGAGAGGRNVVSAGATAGSEEGTAARTGEHGGAGLDDAATASRGTERSGPLALVEVRVDHAALVRGRVEGDEVCEIEGLGPIPVAEAQRLASDSILRVLLVDGGVVKKISSTTRSIPPRLKRVILDRDRTCVVPGCDVSWNLEIDHRIPFAQGGRTDEENLARLCCEHHRQKTAGKAILERWEDDRGRPHWAWHPTTRPNQPPPLSFEERWPNLWTG
ncbi:MAG: HNH endonuclease signature motif containing protein, partial [Actinomycetota bacterium]